MKQKFLNFRIKNGISPVSWILPTKELLLPKKVGNTSILKKVQYVPGEESIYADDHKGDKKPKPIVFENGELKVNSANGLLLHILRAHPWYNVRYELIDTDKEAERELEDMELVEDALQRINISDEDELRATGLVLLGTNIMTWKPKTVLSKLKKLAFDQPKKVIDELTSDDYNGKYVACLALLKEIVVTNPTRTRVTWKSNGNDIVRVAAGEDPIKKLGEYLNQNDEQSIITLQSIGEKLKRKYEKKKPPNAEKEISEIIENNADESVSLNEDSKKVIIDLEAAQTLYQDLFDKEVPPRFKNDVEWIQNKIDEKKAETAE